MLSNQILQLKKSFSSYCAHITKMLEDSYTGLYEDGHTLLEKIISKDEPMANKFEIDIDQACVELIAQYEPKAIQLRTVLMIMKINNDLERVGDLITNIAESGIALSDIESNEFSSEIRHAYKLVRIMFEESIRSFLYEDITLAQVVLKKDDEVDELRTQLLNKIATKIFQNSDEVKNYLHIERISRSLERIADHSTNIAEDVIYMIEGENVKHKGGK